MMVKDQGACILHEYSCTNLHPISGFFTSDIRLLLGSGSVIVQILWPCTDQIFPFPLLRSHVALFCLLQWLRCLADIPSDIHLHPMSNLNLSCHAASHSPAHDSWIVIGKPQSRSQELFIPSAITTTNGSYISLVHN